MSYVLSYLSLSVSLAGCRPLALELSHSELALELSHSEPSYFHCLTQHLPCIITSPHPYTLSA